MFSIVDYEFSPHQFGDWAAQLKLCERLNAPSRMLDDFVLLSQNFDLLIFVSQLQLPTHKKSRWSLIIIIFLNDCRFTPEALSWLFIKGLLGWFMQVMLLKVTLLSLGSGEAPLLDIVAYAGYAFTGLCLAAIGRITLKYSYYFLMPWMALCMGIFLVKTMKRVLFAEVRSYDSSRHHYLLLFIALAQFPLFTWLGNVSVNWLIWNGMFLTFFFFFHIIRSMFLATFRCNQTLWEEINE